LIDRFPDSQYCFGVKKQEVYTIYSIHLNLIRPAQAIASKYSLWYICGHKQVTHYKYMKAALAGVKTSPVNMEERQNLGIKAGDTVRVHQKIQDKGKTRIQIFEGLVLARKHGNEPGATFTVRKVASGVGVEKIFPLYSPMIDKLEIVKRSKVRRGKLYFIREKVAREIKRQMRRTTLTDLATMSEAEAKVLAEKEAEAAEEAAAKAEAEVKAAEEAAAAEVVEETPAEEVAEEATPAEEVTEEAPTAEADDLTKIEGIGPKIAETLVAAGVTTFAALADAKDEDTQEMIKDVAGNHQADTWNEQAALARDGKWDELKELQDKLDGGKVVE